MESKPEPKLEPKPEPKPEPKTSWKELKEYSRGSQDEFIEKYKKTFIENIMDDLKFKNKIATFVKSQKSINNSYSYDYELEQWFDERYVYCNFRFDKPVEYDFIDFLIGNCRYERFYRKLSNDEVFIPFYHSRYGVPTLKHNSIKITFRSYTELKEKPNIIYDVHKMTQDCYKEQISMAPVFCHEINDFTNRKKVYANFQRLYSHYILLGDTPYLNTPLRLNGNQPVTTIVGIVNEDENLNKNEELNEITFNINRDLFEVTVKITKQRGNVYEYELPETINLSRIVNITILNNKFTEIYGKILTIEKFQSGMAALAFSK